ncbi:DNA repair protein [Apiospora aurea]|uniref:DNA repair protein n=1 Tax=Apiospora aurea TaxID=335848 RepID=A0ABR1PRR1_9PEZI
MSWQDSEEPPTKKRRFFSDPVEDLVYPGTANNAAAATSQTSAAPPPQQQPPLPERPAQDASLNRPNAARDEPPIAFDLATFESFIGNEVEPEVIDVLRRSCRGDIQKAVNMYFDGTYKKLMKASPAAKPATQQISQTDEEAEAQKRLLYRHQLDLLREQGRARLKSATQPIRYTLTAEEEQKEAQRVAENRRALDLMQPYLSRVAKRESIPESRYIGAFGAEGWATRSGTDLLKFGDPVRITREKMQQPRPGRDRNDVIVRFTDAKGTEIGRLAKETANWVSSLIDQGVCKFEGTCFYAPDRLRTNETVYLQLKAYIIKSAFENGKVDLAANRTTAFFESKETTQERDLRLRQISLVKLFKEINLAPTRANEVAKNGRQGLLDAAEADEKKEKANTNTKNGNNPPGSSPPSSDAEEGEELEQGQLDALYRKAQSFDFNTPEAEPADTFAMDLRPYQKQSLHWMLSKEKDQKNEDRGVSMHPLWEEYSWPTKDCDDKDTVQVEGQPCFYVNPYSGEMSLQFPEQEQHCLGGILADEMGLGKTIQMLSLIHTHKSEAAKNAATNPIDSVNQLSRLSNKSSYVVAAPKTTLVIAPMSLLAQWQSEAEAASKEGTLKSMVYYGNEKVADLQSMCAASNIASAPDVIITSYGVVLSEFTQINKKGFRSFHTGLFSLNFFRVILDEGHNIKNRQSKTSKACYELNAEHRWVLTGTPIVNRLEDLFSLIRFLRVEPWNNFSFWRTFITVPFESKDFMRALDVVQTVLEPLVMRRTKDMKTPDGKFLVPLPPKTIEIVDVELSETERSVYEHIFTRAKRTFSNNIEKGTVMKAYTTIFAQILRLRQSCCHPLLVRNQDIVADEEEAGAQADAAAGLSDDMDLQSLIEQFTANTDVEKNANTFGAHVLQQIRDEASNECPVCSEEPMIEQTVTGCWHSACKKCLLDYIKHSMDRHQTPRCFNCREPLSLRDLFEVVRHDDDPNAGSSTPKISLQRLGVNESSSKVVALIKHLRALRKEHPVMKSVVFSQFTSFMSLIEPALTRANMRFLRLDGTMAQKARAAVLEEFRASNRFTILLISLRAGGVGLNLTQAKRVYMMDPWWSFAVEAQAIDRVHRMGQDDEVKVYRFIAKDSVEERMLKVQDRKKFIATSLGMMTDEEKKLARIEDIKELLS